MNDTVVLSDFPSFLDLLPPSASALTLLHVNIRSIRKYWEDFQIIVESVKDTVDVFVLTEINVVEEGVSQQQFSLPGFQAFFLTRNAAKGGGIAVYVKTAWSAARLDLTFQYAECLSLKLYNANVSVSLLSFYRPPSESARLFLDEFNVILGNMPETDRLCLAGDFNIDLLKPSKAVVCDYLNILSSYGIESVILAATREEFLSQKMTISCIDHINVRNFSTPTVSVTVTQKLADHYFVGCRIGFKVQSQVTDQQRQITVVNFNKLDRLIAAYDWDAIITDFDYTNTYIKLVDNLSHFRAISTTTIRMKKRRQNQPWITSDVLSAIKEKDILWAKCRRAPRNDELRLQYQVYRNRVNAMVRFRKRQYFQDKFFLSRFDVAKTWSVVNEVKGCSNKSSIDSTITKNFGFDIESIADSFNRFFASFSGTSRDEFTTPTNLEPPVSESAFLPSMTAADLHAFLFSFKPNKAPGIDNIFVGDLRRNFGSLSNILLYILNGIIHSGAIPALFKSALVRPLYKGGTRNSVESYRPISILPCLALVLEKHILNTMTSFLTKFNVLSPSQYGFVPGLGTDSLLEDLADTLHATFEGNKYACALFLDVSKAFDSISHKVLLKKVFDYGFRGPFFHLLRDFLTQRSQQVSICGIKSTKAILRSGVPQGSVLSPLLFNLYVNDLAKTISGCEIFQYADDTLLVSRHINLHSATSLLQADATRAMDWFEANIININVHKTKLICFANPLKRKCLDIPFLLHPSNCEHCTCSPIEYVNTTKYLGIYFDNDLSWNSHLTYVAKKLRSISCMLYSTKTFLPISVRKMIVNALAYGLLRYGITLYANCSLFWQSKIDSILRGILKSVAYSPTGVPSDELFSYLCLPSFYALFKRCVISKHYWQSPYKIPRVAQRTLREGERFAVPRVCTRYGERLRSYYVPQLFNGLPPLFFHANSRRQLKRLLNSVC
uniref:Putative tick transposon n=1 Tax=Ixodes ricinus TaxID=34613 RepID=A0A6B0VGV2_IXORI